MLKHAQAFQLIADENGGNRASGFQGYGASVQYVLTKLRDAGYSPTTQVFDFVTFEETADPMLIEVSPTPKTYTPGTEFLTMNYSASGDTGSATITPVDLTLSPDPAQRVSTSGCEAADFAGFTGGSHRPDAARQLPVRPEGDQRAGRRRGRRDHLQLGHPRQRGRGRRNAGRDGAGRPAHAARRHDPGRRHLLRRGRPARQRVRSHDRPDRRRPRRATSGSRPTSWPTPARATRTT